MSPADHLAAQPVDMRKSFNGLNSDIGVKPFKRLAHVHRLDRQVDLHAGRKREHRGPLRIKPSNSATGPPTPRAPRNHSAAPHRTTTPASPAATTRQSACDPRAGRGRATGPTWRACSLIPSRRAKARCVIPLTSNPASNSSRRSRAAMVLLFTPSTTLNGAPLATPLPTACVRLSRPLAILACPAGSRLCLALRRDKLRRIVERAFSWLQNFLRHHIR